MRPTHLAPGSPSAHLAAAPHVAQGDADSTVLPVAREARESPVRTQCPTYTEEERCVRQLPRVPDGTVNGIGPTKSSRPFIFNELVTALK